MQSFRERVYIACANDVSTMPIGPGSDSRRRRDAVQKQSDSIRWVYRSISCFSVSDTSLAETSDVKSDGQRRTDAVYCKDYVNTALFLPCDAV